MGQPVAPDGDEWTIQEGVLDVLRFLARRAPWATGLWLALCAALMGFANLGATAGPLSAFMIIIGLLCLPAGAAAGMTLTKGLLESVHFVGWVPVVLASGAAVMVIVLGSLVLGLALPPVEPFFAVLTPAMGSIGAVAAVFRFTWAEA